MTKKQEKITTLNKLIQDFEKMTKGFEKLSGQSIPAGYYSSCVDAIQSRPKEIDFNHFVDTIEQMAFNGNISNEKATEFIDRALKLLEAKK